MVRYNEKVPMHLQLKTAYLEIKQALKPKCL